MSMITAAARDQNWFWRRATLAASIAHRYLWFTRALTLGVRAIVLDEAGRVLLVRHTYTPGWYLPGGGVDRHESAEAATIRELREEAAMACKQRPVLHGLFLNVTRKRDHVACYIIRAFEPIPGALPDWEIAEAGFFPVGDLPPGTTRATRARLDEVLHGAPVATDW